MITKIASKIDNIVRYPFCLKGLGAFLFETMEIAGGNFSYLSVFILEKYTIFQNIFSNMHYSCIFCKEFRYNLTG